MAFSTKNLLFFWPANGTYFSNSSAYFSKTYCYHVTRWDLESGISQLMLQLWAPMLRLNWNKHWSEPYKDASVWLFCFKTRSYYVVQASLELLLSQLLECWEYRQVPPALMIFDFQKLKLCMAPSNNVIKRCLLDWQHNGRQNWCFVCGLTQASFILGNLHLLEDICTNWGSHC